MNTPTPNPDPAATKALLMAMAAEADDLRRAVGGQVSEVVAAWLVPQYAQAARERLSAVDGDARLEALRSFVQDLALLRRGDHSAARLQLEREHLELLRASTQAQKEKEFREWNPTPGHPPRVLPRPRPGPHPGDPQ